MCCCYKPTFLLQRWSEMVGRYHKMSLSSRLQPSLALSIYKITT